MCINTYSHFGELQLRSSYLLPFDLAKRITCKFPEPPTYTLFLPWKLIPLKALWYICPPTSTASSSFRIQTGFYDYFMDPSSGRSSRPPNHLSLEVCPAQICSDWFFAFFSRAIRQMVLRMRPNCVKMVMQWKWN